MGLSRKLGGGSGGGAGGSSRTSSALAQAELSARVDYTWSTQAYTMQEILTRFQLPCVVQCCGDPGTVLWANFRFDMHQPLLLHAARTVRKVHARSLKVTKGGYSSSGDGGGASSGVEEFGPPLAIPEDYDGWFFPVGRRDPMVLPRHTRVEGVATSPARRFLLTTALPAFTPARGAGAGPRHVQHEVGVGEVLTKVDVVKGDPSSSSASSSPSALLQRSRQSLRCLDENQYEVIIPFNHKALMYDVAEINCSHERNEGIQANTSPSTINTNTNSTSITATAAAGGSLRAEDCSSALGQGGVVSTHTLVSLGNKHLPRVFRHVLGDPPALANAFTGLLRCYSVFTEQTVMAATIGCAATPVAAQGSWMQSSCLELATGSAARFNIALNASELKKTIQYCLALKTCEEQAPSYVRAIKVAFTLQPTLYHSDVDGSDLDDLDLSLYSQRVEAEDVGEEEGERDRVHRVSQQGRLSGSGDGGDSGSDSDPIVQSMVLTQAAVSSVGYYDHSQEDHAKGRSHAAENRDVNRDTNRQGQEAELDNEEGYINNTQTAYDARKEEEEDDDDNESVTTVDDVNDSILDTASLSDATDMAGGTDSCYDGGTSNDEMVEVVDANAEFDIAWGHLKRARSFSGSISTLTNGSDDDDSRSLSSDCSSDGDSVETEERRSQTSSLSRNDSSTGGSGSKGTNSSTSAETVVLRNSAPSPVYANVQKGKMSVLDIPEQELAISGAACGPGDDESRSTDEAEGSPGQECVVYDRTVRGMWNLTPTVDGAKDLSTTSYHGDGSHNLDFGVKHEVGEEATEPIVWGDDSESPQPNISLDGITSDSKLRKAPSQESGAKSDTRVLERKEKVSLGSSIAKPHSLLSAKSSTASTGSNNSLLMPRHPLLSSKSSVQSEGSAQDLVIQRLERALNDANTFLKSSDSPPVNHPTAPPRRGRSADPAMSAHVTTLGHSEESSSDPQELQFPGGRRTRAAVQGESRELPNGSTEGNIQRNPMDGLSASSSATAAVGPSAFHPLPDRCVSTARFPLNSRSTTGVHQQADRYQSDSRLNDLSRTAQRDAEYQQQLLHQSEGQIDLEFVKTLGDRLMAVSRKSSLPRYQRLQQDQDNLRYSSYSSLQTNDGCSQHPQRSRGNFASVANRPDQVQILRNDSAALTSGDTGVSSADLAKVAAGGERWDDDDATQKEAILEDWDSLDEEVV